METDAYLVMLRIKLTSVVIQDKNTYDTPKYGRTVTNRLPSPIRAAYADEQVMHQPIVWPIAGTPPSQWVWHGEDL